MRRLPKRAGLQNERRKSSPPPSTLTLSSPRFPSSHSLFPHVPYVIWRPSLSSLASPPSRRVPTDGHLAERKGGVSGASSFPRTLRDLDSIDLDVGAGGLSFSSLSLGFRRIDWSRWRPDGEGNVLDLYFCIRSCYRIVSIRRRAISRTTFKVQVLYHVSFCLLLCVRFSSVEEMTGSRAALTKTEALERSSDPSCSERHEAALL